MTGLCIKNIFQNQNKANGLRSKTESDVNGRTTEKLLKDSNGNNLFGTYFNYRKHGNRGTDMISSIRYGSVKNGNYMVRGGLKYSYDSVGNISEVFENGISMARYTYDSLSRLTREDNRAVGKTFLFAYDNNGNILSKIEAVYTVKPTDEIVDYENIFLYGYDGVQGDRLTGINGESITYDRIGNPLDYFGKTLTWQKGRQLVSFDNIAFTYDGYGRRIKKNNTVYTYSAEGMLVKQSDGTNAGTLEFIYDGNSLVGFRNNSVDYIYRKNICGDITEILDMSGNILVRYDYDAWGRHATTDNSGINLGQINPFRYRGYIYDVETGLYFLKTRYYDPTVGRFINADEVSYIDPETIGGLNLYAYCGNNPVMRIDPNGTSFWSWLWSGLSVIAGIALCFVPGMQLLGAGLIVGGGAGLVSNTMSALGVESKTATQISAGLNIVAGTIMLFTPLASLGASMIGAGVGSFAGGYISEALGGSYELGATIGSILGGIVGGQVYKGIQNIRMARQGVTIGKGMDNVRKAATLNDTATYKSMKGYNIYKSIGGESYANKMSLVHNKAWISSMMKHGAIIYDNGLSVALSKGPWYSMELSKVAGYFNYVKMW